MPIAAKDLNNQLLAAGIAPDTPTVVYFWLSADMYGENSIIAGTNMLSNTIKATVSAYDAETFAREIQPALEYVSYVGGCCGSNAEYIRTLRRYL